MTQLTTPTFTMNLHHGLAVFWMHITVMQRSGERWDFDLVKDRRDLVNHRYDLRLDGGGFGVMQIRSLAAQTTVAILAELGLPCAIFGSMACKLYGNQRIPNVGFFSFPQCSHSSLVIGHRHPRSSASRACLNYTGRDQSPHCPTSHAKLSLCSETCP